MCQLPDSKLLLRAAEAEPTPPVATVRDNEPFGVTDS